MNRNQKQLSLYATLSSTHCKGRPCRGDVTACACLQQAQAPLWAVEPMVEDTTPDGEGMYV